MMICNVNVDMYVWYVSLVPFLLYLKQKTDIRINRVGISIKKMTFVLFSPDFIT